MAKKSKKTEAMQTAAPMLPATPMNSTMMMTAGPGPLTEETRAELTTMTGISYESGFLPRLKKGVKAFLGCIAGGQVAMDPNMMCTIESVDTAAGIITLKVYSPMTEDPDKRSKLAKDIVALIEPELKDKIGGAVERALAERSIDELEKAKTRIEAGERPRLERYRGCLFVELGEKAGGVESNFQSFKV